MSNDRLASLRHAENLVSQGRIEQAITEYSVLVEEQPHDWNTANLLGDLYLRVGQVEHAIEQFVRLAEGLHRQGFLPKALATYKKIAKLKPDADEALMHAGALAAEQGLLADARSFFTAAATSRRGRGDARGALKAIIELGALDPHDVAARMSAARARYELDDISGALSELVDLGLSLIAQGRALDAVAPISEVLRIDPGNVKVAAELARALLLDGRTAEAARLMPEVVEGQPRIVLVAAVLNLLRGDTAGGHRLLDTVLARGSQARREVEDLAAALLPQQPDVAYHLVERLASARLAAADRSGAIGSLKRFIDQVPQHVAARVRLVEVCADGSNVDADALADAQAGLGDAYLAAGRIGDARSLAEGLLLREPWEPAHYMRLGTALAAAGHRDPDRALADWLADTSIGHLDEAPEGLPHPGARHDVRSREVDAEPPLPAPPVPSAVDRTSAVSAAKTNPSAVDLDAALGAPASAGQPVAPPELAREGGTPPPDAAVLADLESVFAQLRERTAQLPADDAADAAFTRGNAMFEAGDLVPAVEHLRAATRSPRHRFGAASLLARIYESRGQTAEALEWLGHAADAPGVIPARRWDTLMRLADLLERTGEPTGALAVCLELQADGCDAEDLAARIARLSLASGG